MSELLSTARHSFKKSAVNEAAQMSKNAFGQTVLGGVDESSPVLPNAKQDVEGGLVFQSNVDIFDSPHLQEWAKQAGVDAEPFEEESSEDTLEDDLEDLVIEKSSPVALISPPVFLPEEKLTRFKRTVVAEPNQSSTLICVNEACRVQLPANARFCSQCGTPQLGRHCIHCGYHFESKEKFCPECGEQR